MRGRSGVRSPPPGLRLFAEVTFRAGASCLCLFVGGEKYVNDLVNPVGVSVAPWRPRRLPGKAAAWECEAGNPTSSSQLNSGLQ